jgi:hypothetical protein
LPFNSRRIIIIDVQSAEDTRGGFETLKFNYSFERRTQTRSELS